MLNVLNMLNALTVLNVLNVLNVINVVHVLHVLHVLNMPMDALLACWALFVSFLVPYFVLFFSLVNIMNG